MLFALLSPAKKLDFAPLALDFQPAATQPELLQKAAVVAARAKKLSREQIKRLMDISPKLAELNYDRFQSFDPANNDGTKPALFAFAGDVYVGLEARTLRKDDVAFAQKHIGILSGLYGLLRPLDAIQPYRLEMGSRLDVDQASDLYGYWRPGLTAHLNDVTRKMKSPIIVNLASEEYWSAVDPRKLTCPVVQPVFKEIKDGRAKVISFLAKKARGMMARAIIDHRWTKPDDLKAFDTAGYRYDAKASQGDTWVFSRKA